MEFYTTLFVLSLIPVGWCDFELSIAHVNDIHSYFFESTAKGLRCTEEDKNKGLCMGGIARQVTKIKEIRSTEKNVLVLASGDFYLANSFYPLHGWKLASVMIPYLTLNATSLGNHDFGHGMFETAAYILSLKCPVLACNLIGRNGSFWQSYVNKSIVLNVGNETIGIVGYISPETKHWSLTGKSFRLENEIPCLKREVKKMKTKGVNKIIAIGHSGYHMDKVIAKMVPGIDVIVGGNSDVFLETPTGLEVDEENISYPYPTIIHRERKANTTPEDIALVVQVPQHGRHVGHLKVIFDDNGHIVNYSGSAILLDSSIPPDPETEAKLNESRNTIERTKNWFHIPEYDDVIGYAPSELEGHHKECRMRECSLGNMVADAIVHAFLHHSLGRLDVNAGVWNSGSIRSSISPGNITFRDLTYALYLGDSAVLHTVTGEKLKDMLEKSVAKYDPTGISPPGSFLQVSRMKVEFDLQKQVGERVVNLEIACSTCNDTEYQTVIGHHSYNIAMPGYFLRGGDGFFNHMGVRFNPQDLTDALAITQYLGEFKPSGQVEGRITFVERDDRNQSIQNKEQGDEKDHAYSILYQKLKVEPQAFVVKVSENSDNTSMESITSANVPNHIESSTENQDTVTTNTTYTVLANEKTSAPEDNFRNSTTVGTETTDLSSLVKNSNSTPNSDTNQTSVDDTSSSTPINKFIDIESANSTEFWVQYGKSSEKNELASDNVDKFESEISITEKASSSIFSSTFSSSSTVKNVSSTANNIQSESSDSVSNSKLVTDLHTEEPKDKHPGVRRTPLELTLELTDIFQDDNTMKKNISDTVVTAVHSSYDKYDNMTKASEEHDGDHSKASTHHDNHHGKSLDEDKNVTRKPTSAQISTEISLISTQNALNVSSKSTDKKDLDVSEDSDVNMNTTESLHDLLLSHRTYKKDLSAESRKLSSLWPITDFSNLPLPQWLPDFFGANRHGHGATTKKPKNNETASGQGNGTEISRGQSTGNSSTSANLTDKSFYEANSSSTAAKGQTTGNSTQKPKTVNTSNATERHEPTVEGRSRSNASLANTTNASKNCTVACGTSTMATNSKDVSSTQNTGIVSPTSARTTTGTKKRHTLRYLQRSPAKKTSFWDSFLNFFHYV